VAHVACTRHHVLRRAARSPDRAPTAPSWITRPHVVFLCLGTLFGLTLLVVTPPLQVADEYHHLLHAFSVSEGRFRATRSADHPGDFQIGGVLPTSVVELFGTVNRSGRPIAFHPENKQAVGDVIALFGRPLDLEHRQFASFFSTARNSPVPYGPPALGIGLGRLLGAPPIALLYLGRLSNLLIWLTLTSLAIQLVPLHRWVLVLLALTPMSLFQAASLSPDAFVNALSFVAIAFWLHLALGPVPAVTGRHAMVLALLTVLLGLSKQVYLLLAGLYLLIPVRKLGTRGRYLVTGLVLGLAGAATIAAWAWLFRDLYFPARLDRSVVFAPSEQVRYIVHNPGRYLETCWLTLRSDGWWYFQMFIGVLGWLDTVLPTPVYHAYLVALVAVALADNREVVPMGLPARLTTWLLFGGAVLGIMTTLYVVWNALAFPVVQGVQGRYFIPFAPLLFLPLYNQRLRVPRPDLLGVAVAGFVTVILLVTVRVVVSRYYLD
jgi:uncharacterized membrane protein